MKELLPVRRPLIGLAVATAAGLGIERAIGIHPAVALGLCGVVLSLLLLKRSSILIAAAVALLAAAHGAMDQAERGAGWRQAAGMSERTSVLGTVLDNPSASSEQPTIRLRTAAVHTGGGWVHDRSVLNVFLPATSHPVHPGDLVLLDGRGAAYDRPRAGVSGWLRAEGDPPVRSLACAAAYHGWLPRGRNAAASRLEQGVDPGAIQIPLLSALLLGARQELPASLYQLFSRTGTLHIFAISGLHVGVMAAILCAALKIAGVSRRVWGLFLIPALLLYAVSTGMKPSAVRAFTMAAVFFAAPLLGRRPDLPSAVALAALLMLAVQPHQIGDPGFLLSFTVVSGIIMMSGAAHRTASAWFTAEPGQTWRRLSGPFPGAPLWRWIATLMVTSVAAWIFSMPLTARFFNTMSPIALVGNLVVIPLTFIVVLTGCLALLSGLFWTAAAVHFNLANGVFTSLLLGWIEWASALPGGWVAVSAPPILMLVLWYTGWSALLIGPREIRYPAVVCVLFALLAWGAHGRPQGQSVEIVRESHSAVAARLPGTGWVLACDGNPRQTERTIRTLQRRGVHRVQTLVFAGDPPHPDTVRRLEEHVRPREIRIVQHSEPVCWPAGEGSLCMML